MKNLQFFGAPHVALLFMAPVYETVRVAGDVGMFGQSLLLSLEAHGLGGVPQTLLSFFAGAAREVLGIDPMYKMLFGIRSEEHTSELQSLMRISYAVFCLKK